MHVPRKKQEGAGDVNVNSNAEEDGSRTNRRRGRSWPQLTNSILVWMAKNQRQGHRYRRRRS